jgi:hypothetical protein
MDHETGGFSISSVESRTGDQGNDATGSGYCVRDPGSLLGQGPLAERLGLGGEEMSAA